MMPHARHRYLYAQIKQDLTWSKTIALLGMRQVGKTTLMKSIARSYFSFDEGVIRNKALQEDWSFLEGADFSIGLDECQTVPPLFRQIKFRVDQNDRPGQFILTGSVRFLSKKDIHESLTGRISILELLPMNLSESHHKSLNRFFSIFENEQSNQKIISKLKKQSRFNLEQIKSYAEVGGLPGICFRRDLKIRSRLWEVHLETILSRDIEMVAPTQLGYIKLRRILLEILRQSGHPLNKASLARSVGVSGPTLNRLLMAFESLFLIKKHSSTYYASDLGLLNHLIGAPDWGNRQCWFRAVFLELKTQLEYTYRSLYEFNESKTRGGIEIPFLVEIKNIGRFAFTLDAETRSSDKSLKSLTWFKKTSPKTRTFSLHLGSEAYITQSGHVCLPVCWIF